MLLLLLDKDECDESDTALCKEGTYCENVPGSYKCQGELVMSL